MSSKSEVNLSVREARFCYGMSKMTVKDDIKDKASYDRLKMVEFIEFLGRVAHTKYVNEADNLDLAEKIERILDQILPLYKLKRVPVEEDAVDDVSSDESC